MTTTLQIRVDEKVKKDAKKAFAGMGIDISAGVNLYLMRVAETQSIPFPIMSFNNLSKKEKDALVLEAKAALKTKGYNTAAELHAAIK